MVEVSVPDFCTITEICKKFGFTYYTVSYWLDKGYIKYLPSGKRKLVNMRDFDRFINGKGEQSHGRDVDNDSLPEPGAPGTG